MGGLYSRVAAAHDTPLDTVHNYTVTPQLAELWPLWGEGRERVVESLALFKIGLYEALISGTVHYYLYRFPLVGLTYEASKRVL